MKMILQTRELTKRFGGLTALNRLDLQVEEGRIVSLIGPNGAGKTTLFNCLTGVYPLDAGDILFLGNPLGGRPSHQITRLGIARTFQNIRLFPNMTALENIMVGRHCRMKTGVWGAVRRNRRTMLEEAENTEQSMDILAFLGLEKERDVLAKNLAYGNQRRLEIGRALATNPSLLLLDEPTAGMNPRETSVLTEIIRRIMEMWRLTILLIEHDMRVVMGISDRVIVLDYGVRIAEGPPTEVQRDKRVIEAYLGKGGLRSGPGSSQRKDPNRR